MAGENNEYPYNFHQIAGVAIHTDSLDRILEKCYAMLRNIPTRPDGNKPENHQRLRKSPGHLHKRSLYPIYTINPEFVVMANEFPVFKKILNRAFIAVPDGIGILYAGMLTGKLFQSRITGVDLVHTLSLLAFEHSLRIGYIGGRHDAAEKTRRMLAKRFPSLTCWSDPGPAITINEAALRENTQKNISDLIKIDQSAYNFHELVKRIAETDILLVGFGAPKQELFIEYLHEYFKKNTSYTLQNNMIAVGVGGSFDEIAGISPRPPSWIQKIGMKWLFRLTTEPWRWRRQMRLLKFMKILFISKEDIPN